MLKKITFLLAPANRKPAVPHPPAFSFQGGIAQQKSPLRPPQSRPRPPSMQIQQNNLVIVSSLIGFGGLEKGRLVFMYWVSAVSSLPTPRTPRGRLSPPWTLSSPSRGRAAPSTDSEVKPACLLLDAALPKTNRSFSGPPLKPMRDHNTYCSHIF